MYFLHDILPLIFSLIAIIISYLAYNHTKTSQTKLDKEKDFEIDLGIQKELLNNKLNILHLLKRNNLIDEDLKILFFDYDTIFHDEDEIIIPDSLNLSSKWWLDNANNISNWPMSKLNRYSNIYESISSLNNWRNQKIKGKSIKDILNKIDESTYIWQYKILLSNNYFKSPST